MIYLMKIFKALASPIGAILLSATLIVSAFYVGNWRGYKNGVDAQKAEQILANARAAATIRERVKNALENSGSGDVAIDDILRGLAGQ